MIVIKKLITILLLIIFIQPALSVTDIKKVGLTELDSEKNAYVHNNLGLGYLNMEHYYAAIQEFKIAISLNPDSQATAVYYNNLGETFLRLQSYAAAQDCFENAVRLAPLTFRYYLSLVTSYQLQGILNSKLKYLKTHKTSPLDDITIGLILIAQGKTNDGITVLDNFVMSEPKLYITEGVKYYLNEIIEEQKKSR